MFGVNTEYADPMFDEATSTGSDGAADRSTAESAVRDYLTWTADPTKLVDAELIARLEEEAATTHRPDRQAEGTEPPRAGAERRR